MWRSAIGAIVGSPASSTAIAAPTAAGAFPRPTPHAIDAVAEFPHAIDAVAEFNAMHLHPQTFPEVWPGWVFLTFLMARCLGNTLRPESSRPSQ